MNRNLYIIALIFIGFIVMIVTGNVITIGEKIGEILHFKYAEYAFYILIALLLLYFVVRPVVKVHRAPEFPKLSIKDGISIKELNTFARRLSNNCGYITNETMRNTHRRNLKRDIDRYAGDSKQLQELITKEIDIRINGNKELNTLGVNQRIREWAKTVFMVTAISQNSKIDALSVLFLNYKMIEDIILASGFRPTKPQLFKQYVRILTTALVSYIVSGMVENMDDVTPFDFDSDAGIDDIEVDGDSGTFGLFSILKKIRIPGVIAGSVLSGTVNAMLTLRIGYVTRYYLVNGFKGFKEGDSSKTVKRSAIKEAILTMPSIIKESASVVGGKTASYLVSIFTNTKEKDNKENQPSNA